MSFAAMSVADEDEDESKFDVVAPSPILVFSDEELLARLRAIDDGVFDLSVLPVDHRLVIQMHQRSLRVAHFLWVVKNI